MSYGFSADYLSPEAHELQQPPKRNTPVTSKRSRSTARSGNDKYQEKSSPGPSSGHRSFDASSQASIKSAGVVKPAADVRDANRSNTRIDSDPSSATSPPPNLGDWRETDAKVPQANLGILDVAALILNKQIGTGIFSTPGLVLATTRAKGLSVALWTIGGLWTTLFLLVYLEFGNSLPFNGGELVYLDEVFNKPELLATILFSGFFLLLANSFGNSIQFAKHVLLAALPEIDDAKELDPRLIRYIAISVITLSCGIHWFSARAGLFLNKTIAAYKIVLLLVVFIGGMIWSGRNESKWSEKIHRGQAVDGMTGMVFVFYSYQGIYEVYRILDPSTNEI